MKNYYTSIIAACSLLAVLLGSSLLPLGMAIAAGQEPVFNNPGFAATWDRNDKPLLDLAGGAGRGFTWGPAIQQAAPVTTETYNGVGRAVQYFDKARMEVNNPQGNPNDPYYVTTGLLVKELVTGKRQDGDNSFTQLPPGEVQVAGDSNESGANQEAPTYASFRFVGTFSGTENGQPDKTGSLITATLDRSGTVGNLANPAEDRQLKGYDPVTRHNIADVFTDFTNTTGPIWNGTATVSGAIFSGNSVYVLGRPLTEPYWVRVSLNGVEQLILVQLFERRVLTYTPSNPPAFQVEMGNVGQHYYRWRYLENASQPAPPTQTPAPPTQTPPAAANSATYGLNTLQNLYTLPQLDGYNQTYEVSSHDLSGGNFDYGSFFYWQDASKVIFDNIGPGLVTRIWMTNYPNQDFSKIGRIQLFFDGNLTPTVDLPAADFFSGKTAPFLSPLVGDADTSSGGYFSYLPLNYKSRLRIVVTGTPGYYQINYQKLNGVSNVTSFNGKEDYTPVLDYLSKPGEDPKPVRPGRQNLSGSSQLEAGKVAVLSGPLSGPAVISSLKLKLGITDPNLITRLYIRIQWEGRAQAQVDAPLDYFFGSGLNEKEVDGLMVGMDPATHEYYCYFPMPFHQQALVSIYNATSTAIPVNWQIGLDPDPSGQLVNNNSGYFNATFNSERETPKGLDYKLLASTGRGRYVGTVINFYGHYSLPEGDDRTYLDGSNSPGLYGTGVEDYFNGGYGFNRGHFTLPLAGSPYHNLGDNTDLNVVGYRFLLADAISFNSSLKLGFEQGFVGKDEPTKGQFYSSLAFWYGLDDPSIVQTDELKVADASSASGHAYSNSGVNFKGALTSFFEGQQDRFIFTDQGYNLTGSSQFRVNLQPDNAGVVLRRRFDFGVINQQANIYVDGQLAGLWFSPGSNQQLRWREEDLVLPADLTKGKSSINIKVVPVASSNWTEYNYTVFSIKPGG